MEGNQQACLDLVGTPMSAGLFQIEVVGDLYISVFGSPFLAGEFTLLHTVVIEPNPNPIEGCMYVGATNYSPLATVDMGGCIIPRLHGRISGQLPPGLHPGRRHMRLCR